MTSKAPSPLGVSTQTNIEHAPPVQDDDYELHVYDHCPYCIRVELIMGLNDIPYRRIVYGYGEGAPPEKGGYGLGPVALTGKKILPVLVGLGVPTEGSMKGLPESLDIIAFLTGKHRLVVPCFTGRLDDWIGRYSPIRRNLARPRETSIPGKDWAKEADKAYARQKYEATGFDYVKAMTETSTYLRKVDQLLVELDGILVNNGEGGIDSPVTLTKLTGGCYGMDDIIALPAVRALTIVKGVKWPPKVKKWLDGAFQRCEQVDLYYDFAC